MNLPNTYTDRNETGCCAIPNISEWDDREITLEKQPFLRRYTRSFLYMPLNMSSVMSALQTKASTADVTVPPQNAMTLSRDLSPWKAEHLYAVSEPIPGEDVVILDGEFLSKVYEGPFQKIKDWYKDMEHYATSKGKTIKLQYFFYTTCPKCAKHYGKNYVIGLAKV